VTAEVELQTGTPAFTLNTRVGSSCRIQFGENCRLPFFCLCHFLYICGGDSTLSGSTLNDVLAVGVLKGMSRPSHYRAQADLARRLAEITTQPNLERELRHVAEELDHLANEIASDDTDFLRSEVLEPRD
jgi:hypothetical protein